MCWLVRLLGSILIVLAAFSVCFAQEKTEHEHIRLEPSLSVEINERSILEGLSALEPPPPAKNALLTQLAPRRFAPGEIRLRYDGLEGVLVSRVISYHRRYWSRSLNDRYNRGYLSLFDFERLQYERSCAEGDAQLVGRWWERSWMESLPEEKGGAGPTQTITMGRELNVLQFDEISITNTGQIRFGNLFFSIYKASIDPKMPQSANSMASGLIRQKPVSISEYIDLNIKPRVTIKASMNPEDILSNVSCEFRFRFYSHYSKNPWGSLTIDADSSPMKGIASVRVYFELLCW